MVKNNKKTLYSIYQIRFVQNFPPVSLDRLVAASTADIRAARNPLFSSWCTAWMDVPPGEHTSSFRDPGCWFVSSTILAAPYEKQRERWLNRFSLRDSHFSQVIDSCMKNVIQYPAKGRLLRRASIIMSLQNPFNFDHPPEVWFKS